MQALPDTLQQEVFGWCRDAATANALLSSCRAWRWLRRDPTAAALLLMRVPCHYYSAALLSCANCTGGTGAVAQQVLCLMRAGPDNGGPQPAPAPLLQALLRRCAGTGDVSTIKALLACSQPPDVDYNNASSAEAALDNGPHLVTLRVLLAASAKPELQALSQAPRQPLATEVCDPNSWTRVARLLLRHCPAARNQPALATALHAVVRAGDVVGMQQALPVGRPGVMAHGLVGSIMLSARLGHIPVLDALRRRSDVSRAMMDEALLVAVAWGKVECAAALLGWGVRADRKLSLPLVLALSGPWNVARRQELVHLLMGKGGGLSRPVEQCLSNLARVSRLRYCLARECERVKRWGQPGIPPVAHFCTMHCGGCSRGAAL